MERLEGIPTIKNYPSLPRNSKVLVDIPTVEEFMHQAGNLLFHALIQYHIIPTCIFHRIIHGFAPKPVPIKNIDPLITWWWRNLPFSNRPEQFVGLSIG